MTTDDLGSDLPVEEREAGRSIADLLRQPSYTPRELSTLLDVSESLIEHDAFAGKLQAHIVEHDIISISREAAIAWLERRS
jgi:hypothetical protein